MGAYRYLVFPRHHQPTADEAAEFQTYATLLKRRFAIGRERKTDALVFAFEQDVFDQALSADEGFELLIRKWQVHGCELVDKLKFVKDPDALKPIRTHPLERHPSPAKILVAKQQLAQEAIAKSLLNVEHTLSRMTWLQRVGKGVPYMLIALGTIGVIVMGFTISRRIENAGRERRQDTVERVSNDAMQEKLEDDRTLATE
jgi:hypothetical protein